MVGHYLMGLTEEDFVVTSDNYSNITVKVVDGYLDITPITEELESRSPEITTLRYIMEASRAWRASTVMHLRM